MRFGKASGDAKRFVIERQQLDAEHLRIRIEVDDDVLAQALVARETPDARFSAWSFYPRLRSAALPLLSEIRRGAPGHDRGRTRLPRSRFLLA